MKLNQAARCALFAVLELARNPGRQLSAADIAGAYGLSSHHLAKVLRELVRVGLVESVRGAGGGYRFAGNARRATLHDIIILFDNMGIHAAARPQAADATEVGLGLTAVLAEINRITEATLRSITVDTLLKTAHRASRSAKASGAGG